MWFQQLFGDTAAFAIKISLEKDPSSAGRADERLRWSWGQFELHAQGRCLTRHQVDGAIRDGIVWYLLPFLEWLDANALPLLNEEPFPAATGNDEVKDAIDWLEKSLAGPILSPTDDEEDHWFEERSRWFARHALRTGFEGAVAPFLMLRRLGEHIEISWDNERHRPGRPDVAFLEPRGTVMVRADEVESVLRQTMQESLRALSTHGEIRLTGALANGHGPGPARGNTLLQPATRNLFDQPALADVRSRLDAAVPGSGGLVRHTVLTALLRGVPITEKAQLEPFLKLESPPSRIQPRLPRKSLPPGTGPEPWREGYSMAARVRQELNWGDERAPSLPEFLRSIDVEVLERPLLAGVLCAVSTRSDDRTAVLVTTGYSMGGRMRYATALGHIVLDLPPGHDLGIVSSRWSHWPTTARAKAFGAMLLMPEKAVKSMAGSRGHIDAGLVQAIMSRFDTEATATTWHLYNLGMISDEARASLLLECGQTSRA